MRNHFLHVGIAHLATTIFRENTTRADRRPSECSLLGSSCIVFLSAGLGNLSLLNVRLSGVIPPSGCYGVGQPWSSGNEGLTVKSTLSSDISSALECFCSLSSFSRLRPKPQNTLDGDFEPNWTCQTWKAPVSCTNDNFLKKHSKKNKGYIIKYELNCHYSKGATLMSQPGLIKRPFDQPATYWSKMVIHCADHI